MPTVTSSLRPEEVTLIDGVNSNLTYIGRARLGSSEDAAVWQIRRVEKSGTVTRIQYANGSRRFNQVWDDRASVSYSN